MIEKKIIEDSIQNLEIEEYLKRILDRADYSYTDIKITPVSTRLIIHVGRPGMAIGKAGKTIKKITDDLQNKFKVKNPQLDIQHVENPFLDANIVAKSISSALERHIGHRRLIDSSLKKIMDAGAVGAEIIVSGKLSGGRGRFEKSLVGYIKKCGDPAKKDVDIGFAMAVLKQGTLGVKVKIMPQLPRAMLMEKELMKGKKAEIKTEDKTPKAVETKKEQETAAETGEKEMKKGEDEKATETEKKEVPKEKQAKKLDKKEEKPKKTTAKTKEKKQVKKSEKKLKVSKKKPKQKKGE